MKHEEDNIQRAIWQHLMLRRNPGVLCWAVPNGGKRNAREAARMKGMGVVPGVADIHLLYNGTFYALELKSPKGRPTAAQVHFRDEVIKSGGEAKIVWGLDEALGALERWGLVPRTQGVGS